MQLTSSDLDSSCIVGCNKSCLQLRTACRPPPRPKCRAFVPANLCCARIAQQGLDGTHGQGLAPGPGWAAAAAGTRTCAPAAAAGRAQAARPAAPPPSPPPCPARLGDVRQAHGGADEVRYCSNTRRHLTPVKPTQIQVFSLRPICHA